VLGWCSPQSSVPRQTVGHHARAAKYETGPTAACEGCRGEVPEALKQRLPRHPPRRAGVSLFFSHTHRPGRSGAHGPAGSGVDFPTPKNSSVCVSLKIGSRARNHTQSAPQSARPGRAAADLRRRLCTTLGARAAAPSRLPYTPTRLPYTGPPELPPGPPPARPPYTPTGLPYTRPPELPPGPPPTRRPYTLALPGAPTSPTLNLIASVPTR
jgi:hypothetical protein